MKSGDAWCDRRGIADHGGALFASCRDGQHCCKGDGHERCVLHHSGRRAVRGLGKRVCKMRVCNFTTPNESPNVAFFIAEGDLITPCWPNLHSGSFT